MTEALTKTAEFFRDGGLFMYPLAICSLLAGAAVIYKFLTLRRSLIMPEVLIHKVDKVVSGQASIETLYLDASEGKSVLARLLECVLADKEKPAGQVRELLQSKAREEFVYLQSGIPLLEMVINIAPMFGILGTASGLVVVFDSFSASGNQEAISVGIARALNTTITGLAIAAPSVVAQMYFSRRLEKMSAEMETLLAELIDSLKEKQS